MFFQSGLVKQDQMQTADTERAQRNQSGPQWDQRSETALDQRRVKMLRKVHFGTALDPERVRGTAMVPETLQNARDAF